MNKFFEELKRRNVIKSALAYLVVVWVLLQIFSILLPIVSAPEWILQGITLLMVIGLPIWIIVSWIYDITPKGIEKTTKNPEDKLVSEITNKRLNVFIIVGLSIAVVVLSLNLFVFTSDTDKQYAIAVLPFDGMDNDQDDNFFVDGMAMDIHTYLSKINGLSVISDKTIKKFRGSDKTNKQIAKELGVDFLINGNVRKYDDEIRITAQLIDANDIQVWAEPYTRKFVDIFKIQQDVSKEIVAQLEIELTPEEEKALDRLPTENMEAYNLFLEGLALLNKGGKENIEKALELFQQAINLDPNYAEAYAEIGNCYYKMATIYYPEGTSYDLLDYNEALDKINLHLEKALKINPNTVRVYEIRARIARRNNFWDEAQENLEKAISINPNDALTQMQYGLYFYYKPNPDLENRLKHIRIAQKLEPFSVGININFQNSLLFSGKVQEAEDHLNKMGFLYSERTQLFRESIILAYKNKDWTAQIRFYENEDKKNPKNMFNYQYLGVLHAQILNDNVNYLKYYKRAYELDSTSVENNEVVFLALLENKKFIEANKLRLSENFKSVVDKREQLWILMMYYIYQGKYKKAQEVLKDPLSIDIYHNFNQTIVSALLDDREKVDILIEENTFHDGEMAMVYAILKEKDSMYHYLDKLNGMFDMRDINDQPWFDPYRKDERFKALLKKHYLPLTHWNE